MPPTGGADITVSYCADTGVAAARRTESTRTSDRRFVVTSAAPYRLPFCDTSDCDRLLKYYLNVPPHVEAL